MSYEPVVIPFETRRLPDNSVLAISSSGDHTFFTEAELSLLGQQPSSLPLERQAELRSLFFLSSRGDNSGSRRLLKSRRAARRETVQDGPSLHIIVPTLRCAHSCKYCQVSRALDDTSHTMSLEDLETALYHDILPTLDYSVYEGKPLILKGCSKKPVPESAYILAMRYLQPVARSIMYGEACSVVPLYKKPK